MTDSEQKVELERILGYAVDIEYAHPGAVFVHPHSRWRRVWSRVVITLWYKKERFWLWWDRRNRR